MKNIKVLFLFVVMLSILLAGCSVAVMGTQQLDNENFISQDKAKEIALDKAGLTSEEVIFRRVELERDDGVWQYEVEFRKGFTEYEAGIKADDGTVLKWEMDND